MATHCVHFLWFRGIDSGGEAGGGGGDDVEVCCVCVWGVAGYKEVGVQADQNLACLGFHLPK